MSGDKKRYAIRHISAVSMGNMFAGATLIAGLPINIIILAIGALPVMLFGLNQFTQAGLISLILLSIFMTAIEMIIAFFVGFLSVSFYNLVAYFFGGIAVDLVPYEPEIPGANQAPINVNLFQQSSGGYTNPMTMNPYHTSANRYPRPIEEYSMDDQYFTR